MTQGRAAIASWDLLALLPALAVPYPHVLALDPPPVDGALDFVGALPGTGMAHCAWGPGEEEVARATIAARLDVRAMVSRVYRALREAAPALRAELEPLLDAVCARADSALALRVLLELSLVEIEQDTVRVLDAGPTQLERSAAYRAHVARLQDAAAALGMAAGEANLYSDGYANAQAGTADRLGRPKAA